MWSPPADELEYYSIPSPAAQESLLSVLLPSFALGKTDPTRGRSALPRNKREIAIREDPKIAVREGQVYMDPKKKREFINYEVWEDKVAAGQRAPALLVYIHGINDYGGKFAEHARQFLDAGYRVAVLDLPGHGRSSGIHAHVPDLDSLVDAIYLVLTDLVSLDDPAAPRSKIFVAGSSLGGLLATMTCIKYGRIAQPEPHLPQITGGLFLCPALAIQGDSRPGMAVELVARAISSFAGAAPIASANKGKNSEDPTCEQQFERDPQTYHGRLRVGTGLAILKAITDIAQQRSTLEIPFAIFHGTGDRVTSYHGSEQLFKEAVSTNKEIKLYEGYEHILLRTGKTEADDKRRQDVILDMLDFLSRH